MFNTQSLKTQRDCSLALKQTHQPTNNIFTQSLWSYIQPIGQMNAFYVPMSIFKGGSRKRKGLPAKIVETVSENLYFCSLKGERAILNIEKVSVYIKWLWKIPWWVIEWITATVFCIGTFCQW